MGHDNHHDSLFRHIFTRVDVAEGYLKAHLPDALVPRCDWSGLEILSGSYVDPSLKDFETDVLYRVPLLEGGPPLLVYVLLEHQHRVDLLMGFRLLRYLVRIWDLYLQNNGNKGPLPVVVPLVVYHGQRAWTAKVNFQELFPDDLQKMLSLYIPSFSYDVEDLSRLPDAQLQGDALGKLTLLLLKHGRREEFWEVFPAWVGLMATVVQRPGQGIEVLSALLRYILLVGQEKPPDAVLRLLKDAVSPQAPEVIMGWAQQLHDEGLKKGREEGHQEGRQEGRQEGHHHGQRTLLERLLERRFGPLPEDVRQRLASSSEEALVLWGERLLEAASLEAVFADT